MIKLEDLLMEMVERGASDLFLKAGGAPYTRVDGQIQPLDYEEMSPNETEQVANQIMSEPQWRRFQDVPEMDLALGMSGIGRFRVNCFRQRGTVGIVFRHISNPDFSFGALNLPPAVERLANMKRGLILVTGMTGAGKSTTLAAIINHINQSRKAHIVTVEDPIEFLHQDMMSIISQREVGFDTKSFRDALKHVLRQSPDVILIGEMRDLETMQTAISAAETGHLVLSTLHTTDAVQTVERIINYFPAYLHPQVRLDLSLCMNGVISQRLLPHKSGTGRVPAAEILISTPVIKKLLHEGRTLEMVEHMREGEHVGMQTFNQSLMMLIKANLVAYGDALMYASSPDELRLVHEGLGSGSAAVHAVARDAG
jgi:twitching motility protein PilT